MTGTIERQSPGHAANNALREQVVHPADARRETIYLLIALATLVSLMTLRFFLIADKKELQYMRPYQVLDNVLQGPQRALYQSFLAVVPDVVDIRDEEGQWPEAELLAMDNLPPFDVNFLPATLKNYTFSGHDGGSWVDYLANNLAGDEKVSFILRIIDLHAEYHPHPHPGIDYDPNQRVAVQIWMFDDPNRPYPGERLPEAGWKWIVSPDDPSLKAPPKQVEAATPQTGGNQ